VPPGASVGTSASHRKVSPAARKRAQQLHVDLDTVTATGPDGAVLLEDVEFDLNQPPTGPHARVLPSSLPTWCSVHVTAMPYPTNADLPAGVRNHLPPHARDIFRAAFNRARAANDWDARREEAARWIAWAAVKRLYVRNGTFWVPR
jgi:cation transport regulator